MSITLTIVGKESILESNYVPPIILDDEYECGLVYFSVFNSIPNINYNNNIFEYGEDKKRINVPPGAYDLQDVYDYLKERVENCDLEIKSNINTMTCSLYCTETINFDSENSIGPLLGFLKKKLKANKWHESTESVNILPLPVIRIECNLVQNSYTNGSPSHIIYEFVPNIPPSYKFIECPSNVIYFPVKKNIISSITIRILDLEGNYINFRGETIVLRLHLRKSK